MSRNKGKTAEELLQEALVPVEEQPFPIPENWVWVKLGSLITVRSGDGLTRNQMIDGPHPVYGGNGVNGFHKENNISEPSIIVGRVGFNCGSVHLSENYAWVTDNAFIVSFDKSKLDIIYLYWLLKNLNLGQYSKSTAQPVISGKTIYPIMFPLPPLKEQKRIADKVERLLNKINQAKQLIEEAKETFELRRAAILDKAFRGELTATWRDENKASNFSPVIESLTESNEIPNNWAITNFDSMAADERYALAIGPFGSNLKVTDYREEGVPLVFVRNIRSSNYGLDNKFVSEEKAEELKAHMVESGDILITKMGDPPGDVDICPEIIERAIITADCIKVRVNTEIVNRKYLLYAIKSDFVQSQIRRESKGVAQQKISLQAFRKMNVIIAPYEEQLIIVEELEGLMEKEMRSIENLELMDEKLNSLEQAILSKAFRGQLGTNDPLEENVIELLQRVK